MKQKWKCGDCNSVQVSDSKKRHDMQVCECGKSGYDLEEFYSRGFGKIIMINEN